MDITDEDVKNLSTIAKPIIEPIITTLIKPHIERLNTWVKGKDNKRKVEDNFWESKFSAYLENVYQNSFFVSTLVFPNSQTKIKELYVPLTLINSSSYERYEINIFDYSTFFQKNSKVVISDYAGMGKSTLLKWIAISLIEQKSSIPILIELRKIDTSNSITDEIFNQLNSLNNSFDKDLVYGLLDLGFFTLLLDGFDEIPYDIQDKITQQLIEFTKKASKNNFILTSRPESALSSFADFQMFYIKPLTNTDAQKLILKLDNLSRIKHAATLIQEIKVRNTQVQEFLTNPFLVSLLYKSYTYNKDIPSKKITFYEEVYSCLFKHHDLSKEGFKRPKRSKLDIFDFEIVLRDIGFETSKIGRVIYSKDEMLNYILSAKSKNPRIDFKELNFFDDLTTTVPLFTMEGVKIKWAHKSIQDFFSAKYISNHSRKEEIIKAIYDSGKYHYLNILDLLYELEYSIFRKLIIKPILEDYITFYETQFKIKPNVPQSMIDERIALSFAAPCCLIITEKDLGFEKARSIFIQKLGASEDNCNIGTTLRHSQPMYYFMQEVSFRKQLIKILRLKNEDLFINAPISTGRRFLNDLELFNLDEPYVFNDDVNQPYNHPDVFATINSEIHWRQISDREENLGYNLDYRKCKTQLIAIKKEILKSQEQDIFKGI